MIIKLLITILANISGYLACGTGCLICRDAKCLLCDKKNNYYQININCAKKTIDNCNYSDNGEVCLDCGKEYYPDSQSGKCLKQKNPIDNCVMYEDISTCLQCDLNYYLLKNACKEVTIQIPNCRIYLSDGVCASCDPLYFLSEDTIQISDKTKTGNSCIKFVDPNCSEQGAISCKECTANFKVYKNAYLNQFKLMSVSNLRKTNIDSLTQLSSFTSCVEVKVANCLVYEDFDRCSKCSQGYFVNEKYQCEVIPEEAIDNCFEYMSFGNCRKCLEGYYISSPSVCSPHTKTIESCLQMSQSQADMCAKCVDGYYLSSNKCIRRTIIENCSVYSITNDLCATCETNFVLSADKSKCFPAIENCNQYDFSGTIATCIECYPGLYLKPQQGCAKVPIVAEGCYKYVATTTPNAAGNYYKCSVCSNQYYMNNSGVCVLHDNFMGNLLACRNLSPTVKNSCIGCYEDEILTSTTSYCELVDINNSDEYCKTYNTTGYCNECVNGYYFDEKSCQKISIVNCEIVSANGTSLTCTKCASSAIENYFPSSNLPSNKCIYSYDHVIKNCLNTDDVTPNQSGVNMNVCNNCYSPYFPEQFAEAQFCVAKSKLQYNFATGGTADNCKVWSPDEKACLACNFNSVTNQLLVVSGKSCADSCDSKSVILTKSGSYFFYCGLHSLSSQCVRVSNDLCAECKKYYLADVSDSSVFSSYSNFDYLPAKETNHFQSKSFISASKFNRVPQFPSCTPVVTTNGAPIDPNEYTNPKYDEYPAPADYSSTSSLYDLCKGMKNINVNGLLKWGCVMCKFGFTGYYMKADSTNAYFINKCVLSSECNYGVYWEGMGNHVTTSEYHFFTGCHKCNDDKLIPTFSRFDRYVKAKLGERPDTWTSTSGNFLPQTACLPPGLISNPGFPVNCAVQEIIPSAVVALYIAGSYGTANPYCVACKPGYSAVIDTSSKRIKDCVEILNCDKIKGLTTFNKCVRCLAGYVLNPTMDACIPNDISNCYIGTNQTTGTRECIVCAEQYAPSRDKRFCNQVNIDNCLIYDLFQLDPANIAANPYKGLACISCELGYLALSILQTQKICIKNDQIVARNFTYIGVENCLIYTGPNSCAQCSVGFTLPQGVNNQCIISSLVANCDTYNAAQNCIKCQDGYIMIAGACVEGSTYITNCLSYTNETVCQTCKDGYVPIKTSKGTRCNFAVSTLTNCLQFNSALSVSGQLSCVTCKSGYYPRNIASSNLQGCIQIPKIPNCKSADVNTYECKYCSDEYYLQNATVSFGIQKCVKRTNYPYAACEVKDIYSDSCKICIDGYSVRNKICTYKPSGIANCDIYLNSKTCLKCKNNNYLFANACRAILPDRIIDNCLYYLDQNTCTQCNSGYFLVNNTCKAILISNCQVLSSPNECLVCVSGYFLTDIKSCTAGKIPNCILHASLNACQRCQTNYYVDKEKRCTKVPDANLIANCKYYGSVLTCALCTEKTILSKDATVCIPIDDDNKLSEAIRDEADPNCISYAFEYNCKVCKGGYLFQNDVCKVCNDNQKDCHFCDFRDNTNCFVCQSGSYQDDLGKCRRYIFTNKTAQYTDTDGTTSSNSTTSTSANSNSATSNSSNTSLFGNKTVKQSQIASSAMVLLLLLTLLLTADSSKSVLSS